MNTQLTSRAGVLAFTLIGAVAAVACSSSPSTDGTSAGKTGSTPATTAANTPTAGQILYVPASAEASSALGISKWGFRTMKNGVVRVAGFDASGKVVQGSIFDGSVANSVSEFRFADGVMRIDAKGKVLENSLGAAHRLVVSHVGNDAKSYSKTAVHPFDACDDATFYYYVCLSAEIFECASVVVTDGLTFIACGIATAAAQQASNARNTACAPQNCLADWQCQDKYGSNWVCSQGACVSSSWSPDPNPGGGGTSSGGGGGGGCESDEEECADGECAYFGCCF